MSEQLVNGRSQKSICRNNESDGLGRKDVRRARTGRMGRVEEMGSQRSSDLLDVFGVNDL